MLRHSLYSSETDNSQTKMFYYVVLVQGLRLSTNVKLGIR